MLNPTQFRSKARSYAFALGCALVLILAGAAVTGQWRLPSFLSMAPAAKAGNPSAPTPDSGAPLQAPVPSKTQTDKISLAALPNPVPPPISEATLPPQPVQPSGSPPEEKQTPMGSHQEEPTSQIPDPDSREGQTPDSKPEALPVQEAQATDMEATAAPSETLTPQNEPVKESLSSRLTDSQALDPPKQDAQRIASLAVGPSVPAFMPLPPYNEMPAILGVILVKRNEPLIKMIRRIYGASREREYLKYVIQANPDLRDANRISLGKSICFPAIPAKSPSQRERWYVQVAEKENLEDAYEFSSYTLPGGGALRMIPYWDRQEGLRFSIILSHSFNTLESARKSIKNLPSFFVATPLNPASRQNDRVFFSR